jgi:hypothetical protein
MAFLIGLTAAAMLMLGFNIILPLNGSVDALCDLTEIVCAMLFFGLVEDA